MIRTSLRVLVAILIAVLIWWVGPLFALGIYRPFAPLWVREVLVAAVLVWGLWPALARLWARLAMSPRRVRTPQPAARADFIDERLRDLDRQLKARWQREPHGRRQRWAGALRRQHRTLLPWYLVMGAEGSGKTNLVAKAVNAAGSEGGPRGRAAEQPRRRLQLPHRERRGLVRHRRALEPARRLRRDGARYLEAVVAGDASPARRGGGERRGVVRRQRVDGRCAAGGAQAPRRCRASPAGGTA
ncbi:hypothetical protein Bsp3421_002303 [Burkholderia sp. FERM BP-3421]|nr:hypothetical protein [Burkholderia sp. FERM BP-3421]WDD92304.1 hypothetical protein Bsp3421_002303 [Burkholderia sp. FERM BP-3421]